MKTDKMAGPQQHEGNRLRTGTSERADRNLMVRSWLIIRRPPAATPKSVTDGMAISEIGIKECLNEVYMENPG
jgi:hypothetical protein